MNYRRYYSRIPDRGYADFKDFLEAAAARGGKAAYRWHPSSGEEECRVSFAELGDLARQVVAGDEVGELRAENRPRLAAGLLPVDRVDAGRLHPHQHRVRPGLRSRQLGDVGNEAVGIESHRTHAASVTRNVSKFHAI